MTSDKARVIYSEPVYHLFLRYIPPVTSDKAKVIYSEEYIEKYGFSFISVLMVVYIITLVCKGWLYGYRWISWLWEPETGFDFFIALLVMVTIIGTGWGVIMGLLKTYRVSVELNEKAVCVSYPLAPVIHFEFELKNIDSVEATEIKGYWDVQKKISGSNYYIAGHTGKKAFRLKMKDGKKRTITVQNPEKWVRLIREQKQRLEMQKAQKKYYQMQKQKGSYPPYNPQFRKGSLQGYQPNHPNQGYRQQ